MIALEEAIQR